MNCFYKYEAHILRDFSPLSPLSETRNCFEITESLIEENRRFNIPTYIEAFYPHSRVRLHLKLRQIGTFPVSFCNYYGFAACWHRMHVFMKLSCVTLFPLIFYRWYQII